MSVKYNTKTRYGLRTMIELALDHEGSGILQKDIAARQSISEKYLDQIIAVLKSAGLIHNVKGKKSGYVLSRDASEITVHDILSAFDPDPLLHCLEHNGACPRSGECGARSFWSELDSVINSFSSSITLKDLAEREIHIGNNKERTS